MQELREIRLRRGLSQADLSAMTGVAEFTISEIEAGKRTNPRPSTLRKLAQALRVEVADLYGEPFYPKGPRSSPEPSLLNADDEQPSAIVDGIVGLLERWHERRRAEVGDPTSPHFRDPTSAALWVAETREEANDFCLFLSEWGRENLGAFKSVWDALHLYFGALALGGPADAGEMRLREMADKPDELTARRVERAASASREITAELQEVSKAANG